MHTVIVLAIGFGLLAVCTIGGRFLGLMQAFVLAFLPLWFVGAGINMYLGVKKAGYSVSEELPMFLLVFSVPAAAALLIWWKLR
jgi:hypothetical protein